MIAPDAEPRPERVVSPDGTSIATYREGFGPPLVLVHGANVDHRGWAPLLPHLATRFSVTSYDRRGRGASSDSPDYEVEREVEDLQAVIEAIEEPVYLFGHSSGAVLSLQAALAGAPVRTLCLYEPPIALDAFGQGMRLSMAIQLEHFILEGENELALQLFFESAGQTPDEIERMRAGPRWAEMVALAPTTPYDLRVSAFEPPAPGERLPLDLPVLLLSGELSPRNLREPCTALAAALPDATVVTLPDQGHFAIYAAPDRVADEVVRFIASRTLE